MRPVCWNPNSRRLTEFCSRAFGGKVVRRHTALPFEGMPRGCRSRKDQQLNPLPSRAEAPHHYSLGGHPQEPLRPHAGPGVAHCQWLQHRGTAGLPWNDRARERGPQWPTVALYSLTHPVVGNAAADILLQNAPIPLHASETRCLAGLGRPTRGFFEAVGACQTGGSSRRQAMFWRRHPLMTAEENLATKSADIALLETVSSSIREK